MNRGDGHGILGSNRSSREVRIPSAGAALAGTLVVPAGSRGLVVFAHGTGSGRYSPRNRMVARSLNRDGLATLLIDLLTEDEERVDRETGHLRFDIPLLAGRVVASVDWAGRAEGIRELPIGCFGASTGAAAALLAAVERPDEVRAVVSRGGRPDLAGEALASVAAPTLLTVGGADPTVLALNRQALEALPRAELVVVPGATHLFEEPGALEEVARLAGGWFGRHLLEPTLS